VAIGGAAAFAPALDYPAGVAELWDIRVRADRRGRGIGYLLLAAQRRWAAGQGCTVLLAETQDVNVAACRFYERAGGRIGAVNPHAYAATPALAHETRVDWLLPCAPS
jgi:streptothricin acetyltransferase